MVVGVVVDIVKVAVFLVVIGIVILAEVVVVVVQLQLSWRHLDLV